MRNILKTGLLVLCAVPTGGALHAGAADGVVINHLDANNTLVRVKTNSKYLLMPVQESIDDAKVNLLVNGKLEKTFYVRLAMDKVDYTVPFDLTPYQGKDLIFEVVSNHDRTTVREAESDAAWSHFELADTFDLSNREKYRPLYHHTPLYGWMNDPNGMVYKDGVWHLYFQWNPYGSKWQNMTWGHSTSRDLVHWDFLPAAIEPNGLGAVFSGSCALDPKNTVGYGPDAIVAMYTSAGTSQTQSLAGSNDDGRTFDIYPANPVIALDSEARDPNMFWNDRIGKWNMVLAHPLDHEMLIFQSPDLKEWTLSSTFGKVGAQDGIWECPDLFEVKIPGTDTSKWMLICNLNPGGLFGGSGIQYFIGDFDGTTFTPDRDADGSVPTKWLDFGKDNYAAVSWSDAPDRRRTIIGWMSNWEYANEVPTQQFRSANTLPREVSLFKGDDDRIYAATAPSPEIDALRAKPTVKNKSVSSSASTTNIALPTANQGVCEIDATINAQDASAVELILSNPAGERLVMTYNPKNHTFTCNRNNSGLVDFSVHFPAVTVAPTFEKEGRLSLRIFVDTSSIEIFEKDGKFAMTNLVFPTSPYTTMGVRSNGKARVENINVYPLNVSK